MTEKTHVRRSLGIATALLGLFAFGVLARRSTTLHAGPTQDTLRRGSMTVQYRYEFNSTQYQEHTHITSQLDAKVVFDCSEEQLIFFDPNYMKESGVPIPQTYGYSTLMGPTFAGPLGGQLVSANGTGNYTRTVQTPSGGNSGEGQGPLNAFVVTFARGDFTSVSAAAIAAVTITQTSHAGGGAGQSSSSTSENVILEFGLNQGSPPPGWTYSVTHKPGTYRYVVTGNFHQSATVSEAVYNEEKASFSLLFDLSGDEELEAVITPPDGKHNPSDKYENWMPEAGPDQNTPGNSMEIRVVLQPKGQPGKLPKRTAKFKFELIDVSQEPGICLNSPPKDQAWSSSDLRMDAGSNRQLAVLDPMGQTAESASGLLESGVRVSSYDYGAWGKLKVTAILDDGTSIVGHLKNKPDVESLSIPKDDNGNHIADYWESLMSVTDSSADSDDDRHPKGNGDAGDGLSLYEEYRGFMINGQHFRTDPTYKDVFVYDQDQMSLGDYAASGLDIHSVRQEETYKTKSQQNQLIINFNHGYAHLGDKFVLLLKDDPSLSERGLLGLADCGPVGNPQPGLPKTCRSIGVAVDGNLQLNTNHPFSQLISTIAHELAHGSNVWHHGDKDYTVKIVYQDRPDGSAQVSTGSWGVSVVGGQESGVQDCIMRYNGNTFYESAGGPYYWHRGAAIVHGVVYPPVEPDGTIFCDSKVGTGVNDPQGGKLPDGRPLPKAGNATRGDCTHQFSVNDLK